jgi:hypothetical protein
MVRISGLALASLAVTQLVPTLADEATPPVNEAVIAPEVVESDSIVVLSPGEEPSTGGDNSPVIPSQDTEITYATTETETVVEAPPPIVLSGNQSISTRIASVIKVDPRSVTALLPPVSFAGDESLLLCIEGGGLRFDGFNKGFADEIEEEEFLAQGDLTSSLRISGSYDRVVAYLNSDNGLRIWSNSGALAGKAFMISVVALTGPSVDASFCGQGKSQYVSVQSIGLGMNTKKGGGRLN